MHWYTDYYAYETPIKLRGFARPIHAFGIGTVVVHSFVQGKWKLFTLEDVPGGWNLFSETQFLKLLKDIHYAWYLRRDFDRSDYVNDVTQEYGPAAVKHPNRPSQFMLFKPTTSGIIYSLAPLPGRNLANYWHRRFGHSSYNRICLTTGAEAVTGIYVDQLGGRLKAPELEL